MSLQQVAVLSDVHGNVTAFEAVLADLRARGVEQVLNLGDVIGKGPRGAQSIALSRSACAVTVRGNWDAYIAAGGEAVESQDGGRWWRAELSADDLAWLANLPNCHDLRLSGRTIRLLHASAQSEHVRVLSDHTVAEFDAMFTRTGFTGDGPTPSVVGYGDIHDAYLEVAPGRTLFNVGSVGNPLDEPTASYVIIEGVVDGDEGDPFGIQFVRVPYDIEAEIDVARALAMPYADAYAIELRTAVYRGLHATRGLLPG